MQCCLHSIIQQEPSMVSIMCQGLNFEILDFEKMQNVHFEILGIHNFVIIDPYKLGRSGGVFFVFVDL
jgi:hypothetical protein